MAKSLFIFLFFSFSLRLTIQKRAWESVMSQVSDHIMSHDRHGKTVHRPCSSCISSIENLIETLLSSSCQLGLGE